MELRDVQVPWVFFPGKSASSWLEALSSIRGKQIDANLSSSLAQEDFRMHLGISEWWSVPQGQAQCGSVMGNSPSCFMFEIKPQRLHPEIHGPIFYSLLLLALTVHTERRDGNGLEGLKKKKIQKPFSSKSSHVHGPFVANPVKAGFIKSSLCCSGRY